MSQQERRLVRLVWRGPGGENYERLLSQGETRIGRANDNDICLFSDTKASRHHVIIVVQGTAVYVRDLTSLNGTFLNDTRLSIDPMALRDRDMLVVGSTQFRVRLPNTGELERDLDFAAMSAAPDDADDDLDAPMTLATDSGGLDLGPAAQGRIYQSGRITVIELGGVIEVACALPLQAAFEEIVASKPGGVLVDLTHTTSIDSAGLVAFVRLTRQCQFSNIYLCLAGVRPAVRSVLAVTRTGSLFWMADTVEAGLRVLKETRQSARQ